MDKTGLRFSSKLKSLLLIIRSPKQTRQTVQWLFVYKSFLALHVFFQITTQVNKLKKPNCPGEDKYDCPPVTRKTHMEFYSVPFDSSKKFHRIYGQINGGFNTEANMTEKYHIFYDDGERKTFQIISIKKSTLQKKDTFSILSTSDDMNLHRHQHTVT